MGNRALACDGARVGGDTGLCGLALGFSVAYAALWVAFVHFVMRGLQSLRSDENATEGE